MSFITSNSGAATGTTPIANGGTGQVTATAAFDALAPTQTSNSGKYLTTNGSTTSWGTVSGGPTVPGTTIVSDLVTWNSTSGAAQADAGLKLRTQGTGANINFFFGNGGGIATTTGTGNIIIGNSSQTVDTAGSNNVLLGVNCASVGSTGEAIAIGSSAGNGATGSSAYSISMGYRAGNAGANSINIGSFAGRYDNSADVLYIDGMDRTNQSGDRTKSIIYGQMNATVASQNLTFNATVTLGNTGGTPTHVLNTATATPGTDVPTHTNGPAGTTGNPDAWISIVHNGNAAVFPVWYV